jgi:Tfp pilus assembly protein PilN
MRAVNLLPRDEPKRSFEAKRGAVFGAAGGFALVTVALLAMSTNAGGLARDRQSEVDTLKVQIEAVPKPEAKDTSKETELATEKSARIGALSAALTGRVAWDRVLRQVSLVLPEDVWLTSLGASAPAAAGAEGAAAPTAGFTIVGSTYSQDGVARFLSRLAVVPDLQSVRLQSSQTAIVNARDLVQFTILADLRSAGASS